LLRGRLTGRTPGSGPGNLGSNPSPAVYFCQKQFKNKLRELNPLKLSISFYKFNPQIKEKKSEKEIRASRRGFAPPACLKPERKNFPPPFHSSAPKGRARFKN
jgi:hypothetical protein